MKTKIIGLTGGIGSGKTTVAGYFAELGVPVYIADDEAKKILYRADVAQEIKKAFGEAALTDGIPDRKKLAAIVFGSDEKLSRLNAIIHPRVREHFAAWVASKNACKFVIKETAILFESGSSKDCSSVILVVASEEERIKRVMLRDNVSREMVRQRMAAQWSDEKKMALSNYIIDNTNAENAKKQVINVYNLLIAE